MKTRLTFSTNGDTKTLENIAKLFLKVGKRFASYDMGGKSMSIYYPSKKAAQTDTRKVMAELFGGNFTDYAVRKEYLFNISGDDIIVIFSKRHFEKPIKI